MKRLVVIGGGISGLAAAREAAKLAGRRIEILLLEKSDEVGGKAQTRSIGPWTVETGPIGYLSGEPALDDMVSSMPGREAESIQADRAAAHRYLVRGGRLRLVSPHPFRFIRSGLLGAGGILRMLAEPFVSRIHEEESIWQFAARRLGAQAADRLIAPMVLGVFAGDAKRLSLQAAFPRLAALEREHGSLVMGMIKSRAQRPSGAPAEASGSLMSFRHGMQELSRQLADSPDFEVRCRSKVQRLQRAQAEGWSIVVDREPEPIPAQAVVFASEAWATAEMLGRESPALADLLCGIHYPPVAIVALGFGASAATKAPTGFGALIAREEGFRILGVLFDSQIFPGRAPEGGLLVRAFLGGAVDPKTAGASSEDLVEMARQDVCALLGLEERPVFSEVVRFERAIPQYELGHLERVRSIESEVARLPGIFLAGNALHGIAYGKAAAAGVAAGEAAARYLLGSF